MNKDNPKILNDFLNYLKITKNYSKGTIAGYELDLMIFLKFIVRYFDLEFSINDIDIFAFLIFLNHEKENIAKTRNRKLAAIKQFFKYLYAKYPSLKNKLNPAENINFAEKMYRLPKFLDLSNAKKIQCVFNKLNSKNYIRDNAIITLFLQTGIRLSELQNINIKDINFTDKTIKIIAKGNIERKIYLNATSVAAINNYLKTRKYENQEPLFISNRKKRISKSSIENICKKAYKLLGLNEKEYSVHTLRHTVATHIYKETKDILIVKKILGHKSIAATEIYTHIENDIIKDAFDKHPLANLHSK